MKVAGFDIGGANTDLAVVDFENNEVKNIEVDFAYLPMWSNNEALPKVLTELIENICPIDEIDAVGISMTAELVDAYDTKKDGVLDVVKKCEETFECPTAYVGIDGMLSKEEIEEFCHALPRYKRPKEIIFADIPRNATGKIEKPKLREKYGATHLVAAQNQG